MLDKIKAMFNKKKSSKEDFDDETELGDYEETDHSEESLDDMGGENYEDDEAPSKPKKKNNKMVMIIGGVAIVGATGFLLKPMLMPSGETYELPKIDRTPSFQEKPVDIREKPIKPITPKRNANKVIEEEISIPEEEEIKQIKPVKEKVSVNEVKMIETFKSTVKEKENMSDKIDLSAQQIKEKILNKSLVHDPMDTKDPLLLEYEETINSKAMRNEISENVKLMREYIQFLQVQKEFNEAKSIYEKETSKDLFADEMLEIKSAFSVDLNNMKSELNNLKNENQGLKQDIKNTSEKMSADINNITNTELVYDEAGKPINSYYGLSKSKQNEILNDIKSVDNAAYSHKVYRIGSKYILEELDRNGKTIVYKEGNMYKGAIIKEITPDLLKVEARGETAILPISVGSVNSSYVPIEIKMPSKLEISEGKVKGNNGKNSGVEDYKEELDRRQLNDSNQNQQLKSRFL